MECEFKEVKNQPPVNAIGKIIDKYVVAFLNSKGGSVYWGISDKDSRVVGVKLSDKLRDELLQVAGQKISSIAPPVAVDQYDLPFHQVIRSNDHSAIKDIFIVEVVVRPADQECLYLTGGGDAYKRTLGGIKKLSGAELITTLIMQLRKKLKITTEDQSLNTDLLWMPSVARRAEIVKSLLDGARILWVDDHQINNLYERTVLASLGVSTELAVSMEEALFMVDRLKYDLLLSDTKRKGNPYAGRELFKL